MKTSSILILIVALILPTLTVAQSNYTNGYVITNESDTVRGLIDFTTDKNITNECKFKKTTDSDQLTYKPGEIKGFGINNGNKLYISREVDLENEQRTVFLEYLVDGMMNLYYYVDNKTKLEYYFFEDEGGRMLSITKHPDVLNDMQKVSVDNKYRGMLNYIFNGNPNVIPPSRSMRFERGTMINIVKNYHKEVCTTGEDCVVFENDYKKQYSYFKVTVYAGLTFDTYKFSRYNLTETSSTVSPQIGAMINFINPRWSKSLSLSIDLSLSQIKGQYSRHTYKGIMPGLTLAPRYTFQIGKVKPFVEAGGGILTTFLQSHKYIKDYGKVEHRTFFFNIHTAAGTSYKLRGKGELLLQMSYDWKMSQDTGSKTDGALTIQDKIGSFIIKAGYTF